MFGGDSGDEQLKVSDEALRAAPSIGSAGHAGGQCRPCAHIWKPGRCSKGWSCTFCHLCDEADFRRMRKLKMGRLKTPANGADPPAARRSVPSRLTHGDVLPEASANASPYEAKAEELNTIRETLLPRWMGEMLFDSTSDFADSACYGGLSLAGTAPGLPPVVQEEPGYQLASVPDYPVYQADASGAADFSLRSCTERWLGEAFAKDAVLLPSVGSAGHSTSTCRPCAHSWKPGGCSKGRACEFCHMCGEGEFRQKRKLRAVGRKNPGPNNVASVPRHGAAGAQCARAPSWPLRAAAAAPTASETVDLGWAQVMVQS
eukprot:TRINITY_DN38807_c0_g1_i1.p1 TRINITY_DN38807_c0_g1~~TRINITY_DN38807_c0_g1_i1.p1  ORF type:complete len:317 (+),score=57.72 TRINITY_DN38807_c0_g1_i1:121-1071(+)